MIKGGGRNSRINAKILIIDDDPNATLMIGYALEHAGYEIVAAEDGEQALDMFHTERPDLVILDIMVPDMNGLQVCERLREIQTDLPIIMLSARAQGHEVDSGLEAGAGAYVAKPAQPHEILSEVENLLGQSVRFRPAS